MRIRDSVEQLRLIHLDDRWREWGETARADRYQIAAWYLDAVKLLRAASAAAAHLPARALAASAAAYLVDREPVNPDVSALVFTAAKHLVSIRDTIAAAAVSGDGGRWR